MDKAFVIVPRSHSAQDSLLRLSLSGKVDMVNRPVPEKNLQSLVTYYATRCNTPAEDRDKDALRTLKHVCESAWAQKDKKTRNTAFYPWLEIDPFAGTCLLQALVRMRDWTFLERAIEKQEGEFMTQRFCNWLSKTAAESEGELVFSKLEPLLHKMALSKKTFSHALFFIQCIYPPPQSPSPDTTAETGESETCDITLLAKWARTTLKALIDSIDSRILAFFDGQNLLKHCKTYYGFEYIETRYV